MKFPRATDLEGIAGREYQTDIILLDIIKFSLLSNERQYQCLYYLNKIIRTITNLLEVGSVLRGEKVIEGAIPTGDGSYFILNSRIAGYGPLLALFLRNFLLLNNRLLNNLFSGVRTSVHHGSIIPIRFLGTKNFVGDGLNVCARLLAGSVQSKAKHFYRDDSNYVVVSGGAWETFNALFPPGIADVTAYLDKISFSHSREFSIKDKHKGRPGYKIRFIDSAKLIGSAPPRPKERLVS